MEAANYHNKQPQFRSTPQDKEHKWLDRLDRKVYSSATLQFWVANYFALLAKYNYDNYCQLQEFLADLLEEKCPQFNALLKEGQQIASTSLQASMDVVVTAARTTAVAMHKASCLQSSVVYKELQLKAEGLPFDRKKLFSVKTDDILHSMKDSRATLCTLGIYTSPNKRSWYQPYQKGRDTSFHRPQ